MALKEPLIYRPNRVANQLYGLKAEFFPQICEVWLRARDAGALKPSQLHIAEMADMLIRGLARVGIIALIDEATGYQYDRDRYDLERLLAIYLSEERLKWAKMFPDEFYKRIYDRKTGLFLRNKENPNYRQNHQYNCL